jgi:5-bromo-4-chloroindolyl phosphate hydrolysis protein
MDPIKQAFEKIKQEIDQLYQHTDYIYQELDEIKAILYEIKQQTNKPTINPTHIQGPYYQYPTLQQTNQHIIKTNPVPLPTLQHAPEALKPSNLSISTGNEGVPTNQQTNQQTNQHPSISTATTHNSSLNINKEDKISNIQKVSEILNTLDDLKKEVRLKFKKLTEQEMSVYTTIYQLDEQGLSVDYQILSQKLNLSEISIRDYIRKILKKQIPLDKFKENNKKIVLKIPKDLKKIASLNTILQLRQL